VMFVKKSKLITGSDASNSLRSYVSARCQLRSVDRNCLMSRKMSINMSADKAVVGHLFAL